MKAPQLTSWRVKNKDFQQAKIAERYHSHSQTGEPRTGIISRLEMQQGTTSHSQTGEPRMGIISRLELQQGTTTTHILKYQGQASSEARNAARNHSHSHPGEPRTGIMSRLELQQAITATYILESQGHAPLAG